MHHKGGRESLYSKEVKVSFKLLASPRNKLDHGHIARTHLLAERLSGLCFDDHVGEDAENRRLGSAYDCSTVRGSGKWINLY
jgi:hypothetical protein